jgi:gliding motility-associated-like protein
VNENSLDKFLKYNFWLFLLIASILNKSYGQLGSCSGNFGDPIFTETFGTGTITPLQAGTTSYKFNNSTVPHNGSYNVASNINWDITYHDIIDHTPNDTNGRMLVVSADFFPVPGEFYTITISGLCENTTYEFSSWVINIIPPFRCGGNPRPINVKFEIWDNPETNLLASGDTGNIASTLRPDWQQNALVFQTLPGQTSVILKMLNNRPPGCANDFAIDDIVFKPCEDTMSIQHMDKMNLVNVCEDELPYSTTLTPTLDLTNFSSHFYQWQESIDGLNWIDIAGETNENYTIPNLSSTAYYRVLVAEDSIYLTNSSCNASSEIFEIQVVLFPMAPVSNGDLIICENDSTPLSVNVTSGLTVNWYDAPTGGNLIQANSLTYNPNGISGTYYAEAETTSGNCISTTRTAVEMSYFEIPQVTDETLGICEDTSVTLHTNTNITTATYLWSTNETTEQITVNTPGVYTVDLINGPCRVTKTITLNRIENPIIESIESNGKHIVVNLSNTGDFLYSIDGNVYQPNNIFSNIDGGLYTVYVKERSCDEIITTTHLHFYIPKYFTPNNDGFNDVFDLKGIEFFSTSFVAIFNRYGKLLKSSRKVPFSWDGNFAGQQLPSDTYWYVIVVDNQKFTGHFALKR